MQNSPRLASPVQPGTSLWAPARPNVAAEPGQPAQQPGFRPPTAATGAAGTVVARQVVAGRSREGRLPGRSLSGAAGRAAGGGAGPGRTATGRAGPARTLRPAFRPAPAGGGTRHLNGGRPTGQRAARAAGMCSLPNTGMPDTGRADRGMPEKGMPDTERSVRTGRVLTAVRVGAGPLSAGGSLVRRYGLISIARGSSASSACPTDESVAHTGLTRPAPSPSGRCRCRKAPDRRG